MWQTRDSSEPIASRRTTRLRGPSEVDTGIGRERE